MNKQNQRNEQVVLANRPDGLPGPDNFEFRDAEIAPPGEGEVLLETLLLSVDPAMRVWISDEPGYVEPVGLGEVMRAGGIARVLDSKDPSLQVGDLVQGRLGWQSFPTIGARFLTKIDSSLGSPLDWIGPLGGTALTAYFGMHNVASVGVKDRVLVSAAAGGVGQMAGQIAKIAGASVVGIAGGPAKCDFVVNELGFDAAIDYRAATSMKEAVEAACPEGIDVYFDNVGGETLEAALANLRLGGRVALCGRISQTATATPYGIRNLGVLIGKRARIQGFLVSDYADEFDKVRA
ncbi:MAG: NADP-dependent oxidoreductase, partial [Gammaproteobacteria bacterium]|nr:NADP-dependent oxidoreductase [Gammaproteobacteria bacterium]